MDLLGVYWRSYNWAI